MKTFKVHFRHRKNLDGSQMLNDVWETVEATSKKRAEEWGKSIAAERGWWFCEVERVKP